MEENVSEKEDDVRYDPEQEDRSDEEEDPDDTGAQREVFIVRKHWALMTPSAEYHHGNESGVY